MDSESRSEVREADTMDNTPEDSETSCSPVPVTSTRPDPFYSAQSGMKISKHCPPPLRRFTPETIARPDPFYSAQSGITISRHCPPPLRRFTPETITRPDPFYSAQSGMEISRHCPPPLRRFTPETITRPDPFYSAQSGMVISRHCPPPLRRFTPETITRPGQFFSVQPDSPEVSTQCLPTQASTPGIVSARPSSQDASAQRKFGASSANLSIHETRLDHYYSAQPKLAKIPRHSPAEISTPVIVSVTSLSQDVPPREKLHLSSAKSSKARNLITDEVIDLTTDEVIDLTCDDGNLFFNLATNLKLLKKS